MVATQRAQCFTKQELAEFATGTISVEQLDSISAHVDTCAMCQATVSGMDADPDSFVRDLRDLPANGRGEESACEAVVQRLVDRHSAPPQEAPGTEEVPDSIGGYRVLEAVGAGGMGIVFKAQHPKLKRLVAIKLLPMQRWAGPAAVARFEREMEVSGSLDHPNIVRASDAGEESGMHYLVMDYVDGLDLSRLVRRMGPLPLADACEIIRQAARGLAHVHGSGLVHRDIKPSNVMVTRDGRVKILDLGLAMLGEQFLEGENNLTTIGQLMGTLDYMAPEQAADSHQIDALADVYSLGATLFHMLTGHAPYGGARYNSLLKKVVALANAPVPSAAATRQELPPELDDVTRKCLAKDPTERFASVEDVSAALAPFAESADLVQLMDQAASRPEPNPLQHSAWSLAAVCGARQEPKLDKPQLEVSGGGRRTRALKQILGAAAAFALIVLTVMVVRIATDRGEILIRSEDPNARILVRRTDGKAVKELSVEQGLGKTTIRSGQYEVELLSNADRMMIDKRQFVISRGDQVLLTVQERPKQGASGMGMDDGGGSSMGFGGYEGSGGYDEGYSSGGESMDSGMESGMEGAGGSGMMSGMGDYGSSGDGEDEYGDGYQGRMPGSYGESSRGMGMGSGEDYGGGSSMGFGYMSPRDALRERLVYDSKSYNEWMRILKSERNPERLIEAVSAITVLAPEGGSEDAAAALLGVMRAYGASVTDSSEMPGGKLGGLIFQTLINMEPTAVAQSFANEIAQGNTNSRLFLRLFVSALYDADADTEGRLNRLRTAMKQAAPQMISDLTKLARDPNLNVSRWAIILAGHLTASLELPIQEHKGLEELFQEALRSDDEQTVFEVAFALARVAPETEGLAEALTRLVDIPARRDEALRAIGYMGSHARFAMPKLMELLQKEAKAVEDERGAGSAYGMGGYSDMEGGGYGSSGMDGGYSGRETDWSTTFALHALDNMGPEAAKAIPLLRKLAEEHSPHRAQARKILKKLGAEYQSSKKPDSTGTSAEGDNPFGK